MELVEYAKVLLEGKTCVTCLFKITIGSKDYCRTNGLDIIYDSLEHQKISKNNTCYNWIKI